MIALPSIRRLSGRSTAALFLAWIGLAGIRADDYSPTASLTASLSKPMTSIVDGQPFRDGLTRIADQARVNIWLDRHVDPSRLIEAGPLKPTVFAALKTLAESNGCVIAPVDNVLLVGREEWVDQTLATLLASRRSSRSSASTIRWEDLSTPVEALRQACGDAIKGVELPHDLWPAAKLSGVQPRVAITLVLAQFELQPEFAADGATFRAVEVEARSKVQRYYFPGTRADEIRKLINELDPQHKTAPVGNRLRITASPSAHRQLVAALLQAQQPAGPDPDTDTFTVRKMSTSAANALQQLAASAGKKCIIDPTAEQACTAIVTVEGKDVTLKQLISFVANQAGVTATWRGDSIIITK